METQNQYSDYSIDPSFQGVNRISAFVKNENRTSYKQNFVLHIKRNDDDATCDGQNLFHSPVKNDLRWYYQDWYYTKHLHL